MNFKINLIKNIQKKKVKIGVIGLGYVGLPLVCLFLQNKYKVIGFDNDKKKIRNLKNKKSYIKHLQNQINQINKSNFFPTSNYKFINDIDIIILCLPTPLKLNKSPDLSYINNTLNLISKFLKKGQLIILESSTYPGSTKKLIDPILKNKKFNIGKDFFVGYSPEREDPNNTKFTLVNIPKICSGYTINCKEITGILYRKIIKKIVSVSDIKIAEFTKLYENIYRSINIGLVNELKIVANKLNLNIYEIINAAKTKPFGFQPFYPGPGIGGHCIPIDPYYLSWIAKKNKVSTNLIYHAGKINSLMPKWIISETLKKTELNKVLLIGVAYKKEVDDTRESPSLEFIKLLNKKKIKIDYHDPNVKSLKSRKLKKIYYSKPLNKKMLENYDCVFILTDHKSINYNLIKSNSKLIVDTRNVYKKNDKMILKL